jgi:hypothetical protein
MPGDLSKPEVHDVAVYIKSAGLALFAALVAGVVWEIGNFVYAQVMLSRMRAADHQGVTGIAAVAVDDFAPFIVVIVFALVFGLAAHRLRRRRPRTGGSGSV